MAQWCLHFPFSKRTVKLHLAQLTLPQHFPPSPGLSRHQWKFAQLRTKVLVRMGGLGGLQWPCHLGEAGPGHGKRLDFSVWQTWVKFWLLHVPAAWCTVNHCTQVSPHLLLVKVGFQNLQRWCGNQWAMGMSGQVLQRRQLPPGTALL